MPPHMMSLTSGKTQEPRFGGAHWRRCFERVSGEVTHKKALPSASGYVLATKAPQGEPLMGLTQKKPPVW